ncbi:hypothetical protein ACJX0J_014743, partial [Zea mays]
AKQIKWASVQGKRNEHNNLVQATFQANEAPHPFDWSHYIGKHIYLPQKKYNSEAMKKILIFSAFAPFSELAWTQQVWNVNSKQNKKMMYSGYNLPTSIGGTTLIQ